VNRYPSYQEIACDWIGKIPSHWNLMRGRFLFKSKKELNRDLQCENLLSLTLFGVLNKDYESSVGLRPENYNTYQIFQKDDMVFKMIDLENVNTSRVGIVHEEGIMSPVYLRHEPIKNKIDPRFAFWFYYDLYKKEIYNSIGSGVRSSLSSSDLLEMELPVPPIEEQKLISRYLDMKTEQIDRLVEKIQRKIELLKKQRTSLINQYVTKGLDPYVEMKDSGVEWIGKIPKLWNVIKINYLMTTKDGTHDTPKYVDKNEKSIPLVSSSHFVDGKIDFSNCNHISFDDYIEINKRSDVETKDIIMSMIGSNLGNSAVVGEETKFSIKNVCLFKTSKSSQVSHDFFFFLLKSKCLFIQIDLNQTGGGQPFLSLDNLRNLKFPFPDLQEQNQICAVIEEKTDNISSTINNELKRISLIKEYRKSLISSVVSGKVCVTGNML